MKAPILSAPPSTAQSHALVERLEGRREEIEQAVLARVFSVSDPAAVGDPAYVEGLRVAVSAGLDHALAEIEAAGVRPAAIPVELFAQARHAARSGVSLDTVLRRYFAGYTLLGDFVIQEAEKGPPLGPGELQRLARGQAALFDRLVAAVTEEYARVATAGAEQRRAELARRLLAGEAIDASELAYDLDAWHCAVIARPEAEAQVRALAASFDCRLLLVRPEEEAIWAWLGGRGQIAAADLVRAAAATLPDGSPLAIGEPAHGQMGWRLSHRQARAALSVALRDGRAVARYADVALLASMLQDEVLLASLDALYLAPLGAGRGGETLRQTLRAYLAAERNVSSAAAALGVGRGTVANRLRVVEERLGSPLGSCLPELGAALSLEELGPSNLT